MSEQSQSPAPDPTDLLARWGLQGRIAQEQQRDRWIASLPDPPEDQHQEMIDQFLVDRGLLSASAIQRWLRQDGLSQQDLLAQALRHRHWLAVCEKECGRQLPSYFLQRKSQLDQVSYSILPLPEEELSLELYLRIREQESDFETVLKQTPPYPELGERGSFGPVALSDLPEGLAQLLRVSQPGQLWPPKPIANGWALVRLDSSKPAVLDALLRRQLLLELGDQLLRSPEPPRGE